jgi:hypothetical protein
MTDRIGVVLDAGAFIQLERRDRAMVDFALRVLAPKSAIGLVTSAAVVAQVWRTGERGQAPIARLLRRTTVVDLTQSVAKALGRMLASSGTSDPIDAHVVHLARERRWPILTSDPDDLLAIDPTLDIEQI